MNKIILKNNWNIIVFGLVGFITVLAMASVMIHSNKTKFFMITAPVVDNEQLNGAVLAFYSTSSKHGLSETKRVQLQNWQHVSPLESETDVLKECWLHVLLISLYGIILGWVIGSLLTDDGHKAEADQRIHDHTYNLDVTAFNLKGEKSENIRIRKCLDERERKLIERGKYLTAYENAIKDRENKIEPAEAANYRAQEAERKLEKERTDNKEALQKAGKRIESLQAAKKKDIHEKGPADI
jgi:hypothetical protein